MKSLWKFIFVCFLFVLIGCLEAENIGEINVAGVKNPEILLNGTWKFSMQPPDKFWENNIDFSGWPEIQVPGECQMQGFAIQHDQPYVYKTVFTVPEDFEGKHIQLDFYGVYSYARVWVNGIFIREHFGGFTKWSCNLTDQVAPGKEAILTVEIVDRTDDISFASGYAKHQIGGILRDVKLVALPGQYFKQLYFETDLDENYQDAELKVFYGLAQSSPAKIRIELFNTNNKKVATFEHEGDDQNSSFSIPVASPEKWDAEHPNLYNVVTTLIEKGNEILKTSKKIGFRELKVEGNKLLVNGKEVKLRGACRHDIHPLLGRMTTEEYDKRDVLLAKEANMNFIRTSHYPPSEKFLEYCDEYGIYVEDETAVCFVGSHRTEAYRAKGATQNDPNFTEKYLSQLQEMVQSHRNHPSVIIWSIGNENVFGRNFVESYHWVKQNDTTRPAIYSYPGQVPDSLKIYDIISMHYPDWRGNLSQYGISTTGFNSEKMPMLFDEWAHVACYNNFELKEDPNVRNFWGQSLDSMWTYTFESDGGLGGAIWCMIDETFMLPEDLEGFNQWWGILDPNIIPATYMGPDVGYGEWGIIDTWRRKKPEFWNTKKAYSPTKIYQKQIDDFQAGEPLKIPVHNRFDHTNFNELKIVWKYRNKSEELQNFSLEPHQKGELVIPAKNWSQGQKLHIRFFQSDTLLIDEYHLQIGEREMTWPKCESGNLLVEEMEDRLTITGKSMKFTVNKKTGLLENVAVNDEILIKSGPFINLKMPGKRVQYSTIEMEDYAENWECTGFKFDIENGIAIIKAEGHYDSIAAKFQIQADEKGIIDFEYEIINGPEGKNIQEAGLKFLVGDSFQKLGWERNAYFTAFPENHLGRPAGEIELSFKPELHYREKPEHEWEFDTKGFYYFGLKEELPYNNLVRALKENIFSFTLSTGSANFEVISNGKQACRFDKIKGKNNLIINDLWDYNSLLWGNFSKNLIMNKNMTGKAVLKLN